MSDTPTRILLDAGIFGHSEFAEWKVKQTPLPWGMQQEVIPVHGLFRKLPHNDPIYQKQIEALFTVGRLIREEHLQAYNYIEIRIETARDREGVQEFNALQGCTIHRCLTPIERSKFTRTSNFRDYLAKGGRKDKKLGIESGGSNQIAFLEWLCSLQKEHVAQLERAAPLIGLTPFEIESLRTLDWFQFLCKRSNSRENYPDIFHLWTAERNSLDAFLTLEKTLPNIVTSLRNEKVNRLR